MADPPTKRRSSIRLPISTRNYDETVNETTKSQKRVSFSSRNRIKTFMRDNETTQLDATYEESANHTDSTQSSQELTNKSINKPDLSSFSQRQNVKGSLIDFVKQTQSQQEQISVDGNNDAESISMEIEVIERTTTIHVNNRIVVVDKENPGLPLAVADQNLDGIGQMQQTSNKTMNMDITCMDTAETKIRNHEILTDNSTLKPNQEERNDQSRFEQTVDDNMEFTCRLPNLSCPKKNHTLGNKTDMELTCQQVLVNESQPDAGNTIEDTKLPLSCDPLALQLNKTDMEISCEKERSNTSQMTQIKEKEMEFTCTSNLASNSIGNHTEMELTCHPNRTEPSIQKDGELLNSEDEDMEFTCRIPALLRADNLTLKYEVEGKIQERINKTATTIESLEFTCELDKFALENQPKIDEILPEQKDTEIVDLYKTNNLSVEENKGFERVKIEMQDVDEIKLEYSIDVEEMEWNTITPQKSLRKSIISNDDQENSNISRKRSLISSFIPYDSPQIIKKATLRPNNTTPIFTKSATPSKIPTPISCKSKRNLTLSINSNNNSSLDKENLDITTPTGNMETKNILYTQKVDNNLLKGICDFSEIQTPDGSGLKVASPCIDDTQQLIGATFTLTQLEPDLTKLQTTTKVDTLKEIEITLPETNTDTSLPESRFFKNINNTFLLNKMTNIRHQHNDTPSTHSCYLDDISVELVTSPDNSTEDENDDGYDFHLTKQILEEIKSGNVQIDTIFDTLEIQPIMTRRRTEEMRDFIDNFEFETFNLETFKDEIKQIMNDVDLKHQEKLENESIDKVPDSEDNEIALEERIRILAKGIDERIWKLLGINRNIYKFGMVFNKVGLTVELNAENERVMDVTVDIITPKETNNLLMYVHRAIKEKLNSSNVQLSLGKSYDLIGFMQYIEMIVEKFLVFIKEFINLGDYHPTINEDCWLSFKIRKPKKLKYSIISINLLNLDRLTIDDIQVLSIFGNCNVERVEMIAKQCSKLPNFLNSFIKALDE